MVYFWGTLCGCSCTVHKGVKDFQNSSIMLNYHIGTFEGKTYEGVDRP